MDVRTKEAVRYLGYGNHAIDGRTLALISSSFQELEEAAGRRSIYRIFDVSQEEEALLIGTLKINSKNLRRNLKSCEKAYILAATLGVGVDTLLRRYTLTDMARVVILQACAAKRGMRISGGELDTERMARVLLDEYRGSKLGRFTLEVPQGR